VTALDAAAGTVTVGTREALARRELLVEQVVWWRAPAGDDVHACVQIRHRHAARAARVAPLEGGRARIVFEVPERGVAPGQAAVFYDGDRVLGGGFIAAAGAA
jgi:tRNA-specific 2-thiouridylase